MLKGSYANFHRRNTNHPPDFYRRWPRLRTIVSITFAIFPHSSCEQSSSVHPGEDQDCRIWCWCSYIHVHRTYSTSCHRNCRISSPDSVVDFDENPSTNYHNQVSSCQRQLVKHFMWKDSKVEFWVAKKYGTRIRTSMGCMYSNME